MMSVRLVVTMVVLTWSTAALAHGGNADPAPWEVCDAQDVGSSCEFKDHHGDLHRGTCRAFDGVNMCVRHQPIVPASVERAVDTDFDEHWNVSIALVSGLFLAIALAVVIHCRTPRLDT